MNENILRQGLKNASSLSGWELFAFSICFSKYSLFLPSNIAIYAYPITYENLLLYGKDHQKEVHEKIWKMPFLIYALPEGDKIYYPIHDIFKQPVYAPNSSAKKWKTTWFLDGEGCMPNKWMIWGWMTFPYQSNLLVNGARPLARALIRAGIKKVKHF